MSFLSYTCVLLAVSAVAGQQQSGVSAPEYPPRLRQIGLNTLPTMPYRRDARASYDGATCVAVGDIDLDGHIDVFLGATRPVRPRMLRNDGNGRFLETGAGVALGPGALHVQCHLVDIDRDGDLDVVASNAESSYGAIVSLYINDGNWRFRDVSADPARGFVLPHAPDRRSLAVVVGDFDMDGDLDIVASGVLGGRAVSSCHYFQNDGATRFAHDASRFPIDAGVRQAAWGSMVTADIDGDGDLDILAPAAAPGSAYWINDGSGRFSDGTQQRYDAASYPYGVANMSLGDVDGDGDLDMVGTRSIYGPPLLVLNDGRGFLTYASASHLPVDAMGGTVVKFVDLDDDGDVDILSSIPPFPWHFAGRHEVLVNDGSGHFRRDIERRLLGEVPNGRVYDFEAADFDGDGDLDLIESSQTSAPHPPISLPYHLNTTRHTYASLEPRRGSSLPVRICGPSMSRAWLALALTSSSTEIPGLGRLGLGIASTVVWPGSLPLGEARECEFRVWIPNIPQLAGAPVYFQGVLSEANLVMRLTNTWEAAVR